MQTVFWHEFVKKIGSSFYIEDESTIHKSRDLANVDVPELPGDAAKWLGWIVSSTTSFQSIDHSRNDIITKWLLAATDVVGDARDTIMKFHGNSNGLHMLDRHWGKFITKPANLNHEILEFRLQDTWSGTTSKR